MLERPALYAIVDTAVCRVRGHDPVALASAYLRGGAQMLQVRDKGSGSADLLVIIERIVKAAEPFGARIVVNDRADLARLAAAHGVHVGQDDLPCEDVRRIVGDEAVVGVSTHTTEQVDAAVDTSASYVAVGPVYGTSTKDTGYSARGLELVRYASGRGKPVVAIGGITLERVPEVITAGASAVAVISDLMSGDDPERRAREFVSRCAGVAGP
jgi:thiamine-phosphate pyrophosphorylase